MKLVVFISYYTSKKLICVLLCHKNLKKHLLMKVNLKNFIWIHLQTSETYVFSCLIVLLVPLKFLLWHYQHFYLFHLAFSVSLLWCQVFTFYCLHRKKRKERYTILPEGIDLHIQQNIHKKTQTIDWHHNTM